MIFTLAVGKQPPVKKVDFYWPLALAALKNASANSSRTATIELPYTSDRWNYLTNLWSVTLVDHVHMFIITKKHK
jgi:hypothetical protein